MMQEGDINVGEGALRGGGALCPVTPTHLLRVVPPLAELQGSFILVSASLIEC